MIRGYAAGPDVLMVDAGSEVLGLTVVTSLVSLGYGFGVGLGLDSAAPIVVIFAAIPEY